MMMYGYIRISQILDHDRKDGVRGEYEEGNFGVIIDTPPFSVQLFSEGAVEIIGKEEANCGGADSAHNVEDELNVLRQHCHQHYHCVQEGSEAVVKHHRLSPP